MSVAALLPATTPGSGDDTCFQPLGESGMELYRARLQQLSFAPHAHDAYGIGVILRGAERFRYRGSDHLAGAGSLVTMLPDAIHTGQAADADGVEYAMLYLPEDELQRLIGVNHLPLTAAVHHQPEQAVQLADGLRQLWRSRDALQRDGLLQGLLDLLQPCLHAPAQHAATPGVARWQGLADYLDAYLAEPHTLATLAALLDLSPAHFLRSFKQHFHLTPFAWLQVRRVLRGKQWLAAGWPIADIAPAVGLVDQAHFSRLFKRLYGLTPARYQQQSGTRPQH